MTEYGSTSPWGAWHGSIAADLASAADYLSRCQRSLAGEIAPDRFYFADKAMAPSGFHHRARAAVPRGRALARRVRNRHRDQGGRRGSRVLDNLRAPFRSRRASRRLAAVQPRAAGRPSFRSAVSEAVQVGDTIAWAAARPDPAAEDVTEAIDRAGAKLIEVGRRAVQLAEELAP